MWRVRVVIISDVIEQPVSSQVSLLVSQLSFPQFVVTDQHPKEFIRIMRLNSPRIHAFPFFSSSPLGDKRLVVKSFQ